MSANNVGKLIMVAILGWLAGSLAFTLVGGGWHDSIDVDAPARQLQQESIATPQPWLQKLDEDTLASITSIRRTRRPKPELPPCSLVRSFEYHERAEVRGLAASEFSEPCNGGK